ncbi:hypothetical protein C2857_005031 [Epichloe festucae Fl1]|uniref:ABC transporter domain-containing protein n=1 Tax=Epichloe festucae (strain Fl1) TaxID=877507 RepID=A0A7S9KKU3_EPIFF|nr:hypothetical protein C2857_005031 [Epichloe festucae Fl1]
MLVSFSTDISLVDRQLPSSLMALAAQIFKMIGQLILLMQVQRQWLIALPVCVILVCFIQNVYLQTSRQLRVLELGFHSALYSWFLETKMTNFSASYNEENKILNYVNLHIEEDQKLVGHLLTSTTLFSGAGARSTVILGLVRSIESSGTVDIDEQVLSHIPCNHIRSRAFVTVPQEPFLLPDATLSFNLDPDSLASRQLLRDALEKCWDLGVAGRSLSIGELQLAAMARAMAKQSILSQGLHHRDAEGAPSLRPILVLDEAMPSLDPSTDARIHDILEREFADEGDTTVIVAHRISVLGERMRRGQNEVAWVQDGRVVKVGDSEEIAKLATATCSEEDSE